ncbi:MAG TPA: DUF1175 family protein [Atribacteraceae bacterium]|nr:DUF1175 family protein [Atribacteraceae bacterium]
MWKSLVSGVCGLLVFLSFALPWRIDLPERVILEAGGTDWTVPLFLRTVWDSAPLFRGVTVLPSDPEVIRVSTLDLTITVEPRFLEGRGRIEVRSFPAVTWIDYEVRPDYRDRDEDGFPDVAKLNTESDRRLFRERFVAIARSQLVVESSLWKNKDCSGLVRFAYREALKRHDREWHARFGGPLAGSEEVQAFRYPRIPVLGDRLFRIRPGKFAPGTAGIDFSAFASAFYLFSYNALPIGRREESAQSGDLLFFYQPLFFEFPYHVMIYTGKGSVIYHTGPVEGGEGQLIEASLYELRKHPDPRWRPVVDNPAFLGFYRWKILH